MHTFFVAAFAHLSVAVPKSSKLPKVMNVKDLDNFYFERYD